MVVFFLLPSFSLTWSLDFLQKVASPICFFIKLITSLPRISANTLGTFSPRFYLSNWKYFNDKYRLTRFSENGVTAKVEACHSNDDIVPKINLIPVELEKQNNYKHPNCIETGWGIRLNKAERGLQLRKIKGFKRFSGLNWINRRRGKPLRVKFWMVLRWFEQLNFGRFWLRV